MDEPDDPMLNTDPLRRGGLRSRMSVVGPQCLPLLEWVLLVDHACSPEREREMLQHAANCDACAALLHEAFQLAEPPEAGEEAIIDRLPSSQPGAIERLVPGLQQRRLPYTWMIAAAAVFVLAAISWVLPQWRQQAMDTEIAQAFARSRPIEFRLADMPYGAYQEERSKNLPTTAPDAGGERGPSSWRAAVLAHDLDSALARAEAARNGPATAALLNDRAAIHAARGDRLRSETEYQTASALLDQALSLDPNQPAVLFNRAILFYRLNRREQMQAAINRFLEVERDSRWRGEAEALRNAP